MRLRVKTASGSTYHFDNEALTWARQNQDVPDILFMEGVNDGKLAAPVQPIAGRRLTFFLPGDEWVVTTPVVSVEQV